MQILIKYILKSMMEKKMRTILILFAITLSSAVFFASLGISGSMMETFTSYIKGFYGNCDLVINATEKSPSQYFYLNKAETERESLEYVIGEVNTGMVYRHSSNDMINLNLRGIDWDELMQMNPVVLENQANLMPFEGRKIVIGRDIADKYNLKTGDYITLEREKGRFKFQICGIATASGFLKSNGRYATMVVPKDTAASISNAMGKVNGAFVKLKDPAQKAEVLKRLQSLYKNYRVEEVFPYDMLKQQTSEITLVFMMLGSVVFFMSLFIIYSSFKVITNERLPAIGTFRSIGATGRNTNRLLFSESLAYGCLGGILGCLVGIGILYLMSMAMGGMISSEEGGAIQTRMSFNMVQLAAAFIMAIVICLLGSVVPIWKISRIPIKDIVLNFIQKPKKRRHITLFIGIAAASLAFASSLVKSDDLRPLAAVAGMLLTLTAVAMLVPYLTNLLTELLARAYQSIFGNIGKIAANNLRENKNIHGNITMLAIGISSLLMINTASYDNAISISDRYKDTSYEIEIYAAQADRSFAQRLSQVEGVASVYGDYSTGDLEIVGTKKKIALVKGVDIQKFRDFFNIKTIEEQDALLKQLDLDRNIIISKSLKQELKLKNGDYILLKTKSGNKHYKVIGSYQRFMYSGFNCAFISERYLRADMKLGSYSSFYVKTYVDPNQVVENIKKDFARKQPFAQTLAEMRQRDLDSNRQGMLMLSAFSIIASVIGVFGVLNNLMLSFMERKHSIAVYRSMGMTTRQAIGMLFIEALSGGLIGGGIGVLGGLALIIMVAGATYTAEIHYPVASFVLYLIAGAMIMMLASVAPVRRIRKMNLIDEIKYE